VRLPPSTLLASIAAIDRRLAIRRVTFAACLGALIGAPVLLLAPSAFGVAVVIVLAAIAGWLGRDGADRSTTWLTEHDRDDDLIVSGVAVVAGTARQTTLAERVVTSAARAAATTRPSLVPAVAGALSVATLVIAVVVAAQPARAPRAVPPDSRAAPAVLDTDPGSAASVGEQGEEASAPAAAELARAVAVAPTESGAGRRDRGVAGGNGGDPGRGSSSAADQPGGVGAGASSSGAGAAQPRASELVAPSAAGAAAALDTAAPVAGAGAELLAAPPRYRGVVRAFMEAK
jgi:hypothetical protein